MYNVSFRLSTYNNYPVTHTDYNVSLYDTRFPLQLHTACGITQPVHTDIVGVYKSQLCLQLYQIDDM